MGSGMAGGCIGWIMDGRTEPVVAGSTLWSRRNRGRGSPLGGGGGTGAGKGKNWEGAVRDYAHHRTQ
jgi:hypothetical protein